MSEGKLYLGTSGFSYSNWKEFFYPKDIKSADYLSYYSKQFNCTEINSSFYNFPLSKTIEKWATHTPDSFRFCLKMHRSITHYQKLKEPAAQLEKFFGVIAGIQPKAGPVLIQLPPSLTFNYDTVQLFFSELEKYGKGFRFALEARHASWYDDEALSLLLEHHIIHVIADAGTRFPSLEMVEDENTYIRFHGREKLYASPYGENVLRQYAEKIAGWLKEGIDNWVFFNNTMYGAALTNAFRLAELVKEQTGTV